MLVFTYIKYTLWANPSDDNPIAHHKVGITPDSKIKTVKNFKGLYQEQFGELMDVTFDNNGTIYASYRLIAIDQS